MTKILVATGTNFAQIHVRSRLMARSNAEEFFLPLRDNSEQYLNNLTDEGRELVKEIANIDGVTRIQVNLNCISLHLAPVYDWETELSEQVLDIVERVCYTDHPVVKVDTTTTDELYGRV